MSFNEPIYGMELIHFDVVFASLHFSSSSHLIRLSHYRIVWRILKRVEVRREKKGGGEMKQMIQQTMGYYAHS